MKKWKTWVLLQAAMLIYAISNICSKLAGLEETGSPRFFFWWAGLLAAMGLYALLWQQVLKDMPLMVAYANKGAVILWGILFGALFFQERITVGKIVGAVVVIAGIFFMAGDENEEDASQEKERNRGIDAGEE